ncbi:MAG: glycosyltransferase [Chitinophagia bacterium]|nr:glycosyltransferase [Chitinophagia bacterium]
MNQKINIVYLYSEVMPYAISVMRALVKYHGATIHCVHWDTQKKTPFMPVNEEGITFYKRSEFNNQDLKAWVADKTPSLLVVSGRMDKLYLEVALHFRKKLKVVTGSDNQWTGSKKNIVAALLAPFLYKKYFEYFWVPGKRQSVFAEKMGYRKDKIIHNLYTGDSGIFDKVYEKNRPIKEKSYPHSIAFVGRFAPEKGINFLTDAFRLAKIEQQNDWKLILVGAGDFAPEPGQDIEVKPFMKPIELAEESKNWGVFCLPSVKEPWGVVVHEFAMTGLPLLCTRQVGAADAFLENGKNGYLFNAGNVEELKQALQKIMTLTDTALLDMGAHSYKLSQTISPKIAADSLMSILK